MNIKIQNKTVNIEEKYLGEISISQTKEHLPVAVICGKKRGKTLLVTAGIHGSEYASIQAACQLAQEIQPEEIKGQLIIVPICNVQAFYKFTRIIVPEDGKNLNRVFPGNKEGSLAEQIAYTLEHELLNQADFCLDLHGGDLHEQVMPFAYYPGEAQEEVSCAARQAAQMLDVNVCVKSKATTGFYNFAAILGIPSLLVERGGQGIWTQEEVTVYKKDVLNIMSHLGMLDTNSKVNKTQIDISTVDYLEAAHAGFWYPKFQSGQSVNAGDILGEIRDVWGNALSEYKAEYQGIILYQTVSLGICKGDSLIAYGKVVE